MNNTINRRDFLKLVGIGGAVFATGLPGCMNALRKSDMDDFYFVQLSDTHWGFNGPKVNPDADGTLKKAIASVNSLEQKPDFIVFTGDLTHTTEDATVRRTRLAQFKDIVSALDVKKVYFMPGEHDASLDNGQAYQEFFGAPYYTFDHKGIHFIALDNVSDPAAMIGEKQLAWLRNDLGRLQNDAPIVVFTHRPLFDLYPQWDWATPDAAAAIAMLMPFKNVTVFYGHIHQEHFHKTGHIEHHAAKSLIFPLPAPGSQPKRTPIPWDAANPYRGLGFRDVDADAKDAYFKIKELPVIKE